MTAPVQILLVEDDEAHAELVCRSFEQKPETSITVAADIQTAYDRLSEVDYRPDIIVTDLRLPDGLGTLLLRDRNDHSDPPVIVMTSQGDETAAVEAMRAGALDYVVKSESTLAEMPRITARALREWRHLNEKVRLRAALIERERLAAVGTAAAMLAHEIGNPLNNMHLAAELLRRRLEKEPYDGETILEGLNRVMVEIRRLDGLLRDFRRLSRQQILNPRRANICELIATVLAAQAPSFDDARIDVAAELPKGLPRIVLDPDKITQVLVNLFKNAVEAMPNGGTLSLSVEGNDHGVTVVVADTGVGIPFGVDVFEPFRTTKSDGTGLGLPIAKQIVTAHGGSISSESNDDEGTRFTIVLPLVPPEAEASLASPGG